MPASPAVMDETVKLCRQAADVQRQSAGRRGNLVELTSDLADDVLVGADLHGHRLNFRRLCRQAALDKHPRRHLVLQEVCHGGPCYPNDGGCMSHLLVEDIARLILQFPGRVHFLLGNHELAEITDFPIRKACCLLNLMFRRGIETFYGTAANQVRSAYMTFLRSCPLAVKLSNGIFICHSLPDRSEGRDFDPDVFRRPLRAADLAEGGDVFRLVWGRNYGPENAESFAKLMQAQLLIHGHEPCRDGYLVPNTRQIILDSSQATACCLLLSVNEPVCQKQLVTRICRLRNPGTASEGCSSENPASSSAP
jgi:hypothetical protein